MTLRELLLSIWSHEDIAAFRFAMFAVDGAQIVSLQDGKEELHIASRIICHHGNVVSYVLIGSGGIRTVNWPILDRDVSELETRTF